MNIKTILIAGGTGFIGSHFLETLVAQKKYQAILLKRSSSSLERIRSILPHLKVYDLDQTPLEQVFAENVIDLVINFAAGHKGNLDELSKINVDFGVALADLAVKHQVPHYGNIDTTLGEAVNLYARSKAIMREILRRDFSPKIQIFNFKLQYVYGPKDNESKFIPFAISKFKNNEDLNMTLGEQEIDFIHVQDCVSALLHVIQNHSAYQGAFEEFDIGTGKVTRLKDFVESLKKNLNSSSVIHYGAVPYRPTEHLRSKANLTKLKGWRPQFKWKTFPGETTSRYSFAAIDLLHYLDHFMEGRKTFLSRFSGVRFTASQKANELLLSGLPKVAPQKNLIHTLTILGRLIRQEAPQAGLDSDSLQIINHLQKRFEVDRVLKEHYPEDFKKEESPEGPSWVYPLFSLMLNRVYRQTGNFNYLNTVLKINDRIIQSKKPVSDKTAALDFRAVDAELQAIQPLYAL